MKVYVAGKWSDSESVSKIISELKSMGIEITFDWPTYKNEMNEDEKHVGDYEVVNDKQVEQALKCRSVLGNDADLDVQGVLNANVVIAVMNDPHYAYRGTFTEIGIALGSKKEIIIINENETAYCMTNCFYWHPTIQHVKSFESIRERLSDLKLWYE